MAFRSLGRASVREVSESLGRSPEALHYHVKALVKAGLLHEVERRPTARKPEAVYESVGKNYSLPKLGSNPEIAKLRRRAVTASLRHVTRGYEDASIAAENDPDVRSYLHIIRATARLSKEDTRTFLEMIEEAVRFVKSHETPNGRRLHWSSVVFPDLPRKT